MGTLHVNESLRLTGCDLHGWQLQRRIGSNGDRRWIRFRHFSTLDAARAELGNIPKLNGNGVTKGFQDLLVDDFMPSSQKGIDGFMKSVCGWRDRKTFGYPHVRWSWKPPQSVETKDA